MLIEELDRLDELPRPKNDEPPVDGNESGIAAAAAADDWTFNAADWTVLNVDFGIPLFDSHLNRTICERITSRQLWNRETLESLIRTHKSLSDQLMEFICSNVDSDGDGDKMANHPEVALPTRNLLFLNGKLSTWTGNEKKRPSLCLG